MEEFVADTAPVGATNLANYVTRTLELTNPADALKIIFRLEMKNEARSGRLTGSYSSC